MKFYARATMAFVCLAAFTSLFCAPSSVAQVAGQNVNMVSGTQWPNGDPFLQRQNEPSMAVSTRNPLHVLAGANDYRSVDLQQVLTGGAETGDAWLGIFKSFDGGYTWQSTLLPGCPYSVAQCTDSGALKGNYQAAADPVVRAGTNGMFYFAGLAFDRATSATTASSVSTIFVARYNDLNNNEQLDPITYIDTHIVASGNSSQFLDKPSMAVDIPRSGAATCTINANEPGVGPNGGTLAVRQSFAGGNVYLAYTDFLAGTKANSTPTHLMFTRSTDCGVTWSTPVQINTGTTTSQGSAIAVNPVTGAVYVAWRQFASTGVSDAIMIAQSTNAGKSFSAPIQISTFQPFDQGTTLTSFRTNAYPALTSDMFGFVYVAFSARGLSKSGDARVVVAGSLDGTHWTPPIMVDNPSTNAQTNPSGRGHQLMPAMTFANGRLTLLYYDLRLDHYAGFYTLGSLGNYTEMIEPQGELAPPSAQPSVVFTPFIDDSNLTLRRHTLDLRVLELGIFPTVTLGPSVLLSQYEFGCCVNPETEDIEQFKFNPPNLPLFDSGEEAFLGDYIDIVPTPAFVPSGNSWAYNFMPSVNPLFHATWTDNRDVVPPPPGYSWENYTAPVVAGAISVENGQPLPKCVPGEEGMRNQNIYTAQVTGGLVAAAPGNSKPFGTTVFNGKTFPFQRAFPVEAQNTTAQPLNVRFTITNQPTGGTASFLQFSKLTTLDITVPAYSSVSRSVFATSTSAQASISVTIAQISAIGGSVVSNGLSSTALLNPDITNPNITNPNITNPNITNPNITNDEVTNPNITNPNITNPNITNPNITNPNITNTSYLNPNITNPNITNLNITNVSATNPNITNPNITNPNITNPNITNPNITNPNITNPDITNGSIQDVTYPITNNGNTTASYTVKTASGTTIPGGIVLQTIINKLYQTPVAQDCVLGVQTHWITVANIVNPKVYSPTDPTLGNPDITNSNPNEATVTLAPGETAYITIRVVNPSPATISFNPLTAVVPVTIPQAVNTTTVLANPNNPNLTAPPVYPAVTIATTSLPPTDLNDAGYSVQLVATGGKPGPYTWTVIGNPPPGITVSSSGLVSGTASNPGANTFTVQVSDSNAPAATTTQTYTLNVSVPGLTLQFVLTPPDGVVGQPYIATPLAVNSGTPPYTWTTVGLPPGLAISQIDGSISGTPTIANPSGSTVTIKATDSATPPESQTYSPTIRIGAPIVVSPAALPAGTIGQPYTFQLSATGGIPGYGFGPPVPTTGVNLAGDGTITIANPQASSISFQVSVHDSANPFQTVTSNYTINFAGTPSVNILFVTQPPNYVQGQPNPNSPVHIHVQDNTGAVIAGANVTMSFNGTPPCAAAVLSDNADTLTQTTNATGDAFFTFMTINRGGVGYTLNATVSSFSATSNAFNVTGYCDTGSMNTARHNQIVLTLPNGKVLVTGGATDPTSTAPLASAELYDPVAGTFTTISPMNVARVDHTMTLLLDGTVLIAGGFNNSGFLSSAEIFNPANNTFTLLANTMTTPRGEHTATLLPTGSVLLAGGNATGSQTLASAEVYNPTAQTFTATPQPMTAIRQLHHADLLPNGTVLISGGLDGGNNALASAEIYVPEAGTFTATPGSMTTARGNHASALLYNGQVLVAGGLTGPSAALVLTATAELYNPATGLFTPTGSMSVPRGHFTANVLDDGTAFIPSSATLPAGTNADIYDPQAGTFSVTPNFTMVQAGFRDAVLPNGNVVLTSGVNSSNVAVPNSEVYYAVPPAPGIVITTPATLQNGVVGQHSSQVILEHGGVGPLTWSTDLDPNIFLINSNGVLTGNPSFTGSFNFHITVSDSSTPPQSTTGTFSLQVNGPLHISTQTLPNAPTDGGTPPVPYSAQIQTTGGAGGAVTFSVINGALPPSITLNPATGVLSSNAVTDPATTYNFTIQAVSIGPPSTTATQAFTLTLVPLFVGITPNTLPNGTEGTLYTHAISSTGGVTPFSYQESGSLPPGVSFNNDSPSANITGTPGAAGTFVFNVQATDSSAPPQGYSAQYTLKILPQPPTNLTGSPQSTSIVTLTWTASPAADVAGYNIHYGTSTGVYTTTISAGNVNQFVVTGLSTATTYFFVVDTVSTSGVESVFSNEVAVTTQPSP